MTATLKAVLSASLAVVLLAVNGTGGRAEEGQVCNSLLGSVGSFKDGMIYADKEMKVPVGSYKDKKVFDEIVVVEIYDGKMTVVGRYQNGKIYDSDGKLVGTSRSTGVYSFPGQNLLGTYEVLDLVARGDAKGGIPAAAYLLLLRQRALK